MKCKEIMKRKVLTLYPEDSLIRAVRMFSKKGISGAPVVDEEGRLLGVLSETDLLREIYKIGRRYRVVFPSSHLLGLSVEGGSMEEGREIREELKRVRVDEVMTEKVYSVSAEDDVELALEIMVSKGVNRVPVIEGGRVVGLITRKEVLRMLEEGFMKEEKEGDGE